MVKSSFRHALHEAASHAARQPRYRSRGHVLGAGRCRLVSANGLKIADSLVPDASKCQHRRLRLESLQTFCLDQVTRELSDCRSGYQSCMLMLLLRYAPAMMFCSDEKKEHGPLVPPGLQHPADKSTPHLGRCKQAAAA